MTCRKGGALGRNPLFLLVAIFLGCSPIFGQTTNLTYENWAQGFITHNCLGCHHSKLTGIERFGAPAGVDFDTLEKVKDWAFEIADHATGDDPDMPPTGVVWWWDRISLEEWLLAGMPGTHDSLHPSETQPKEVSFSYENVHFYFSGPLEDHPNIREVEFGPYWEEEYDGVRTWRRVYVYLEGDGSVSLAGRGWESHNDDWSYQWHRLIEYTPRVPLLGADPENFGPPRQMTVAAREQNWDGWWGGEPVSDKTTQESWRISSGGIEEIDNGVIRPPVALKMILANLTKDTTETFWFEKGMGIMRREVDAPSDTYIREVTREMNVVTREYPLYGPFEVESASQEYLPLYSRWWDGQGNNWGYDYDFEIQKVAIVEDENGAVPTPTHTLSPDPTNTYPYEEPTATPFPSGLPSPKPTFTATATSVSQPSATTTQIQGGPIATPTVEPSAQMAFDHNRDLKVDMKDLLMFLSH